MTVCHNAAWPNNVAYRLLCLACSLDSLHSSVDYILKERLHRTNSTQLTWTVCCRLQGPDQTLPWVL